MTLSSLTHLVFFVSVVPQWGTEPTSYAHRCGTRDELRDMTEIKHCGHGTKSISKTKQQAEH